MSFKCPLCKVSQDTSVRPVSIVLDKRTKTYKNMVLNKANKDKDEWIPKHSVGWEITKEVMGCRECADAQLLAVPANGVTSE